MKKLTFRALTLCQSNWRNYALCGFICRKWSCTIGGSMVKRKHELIRWMKNPRWWRFHFEQILVQRGSKKFSLLNMIYFLFTGIRQICSRFGGLFPSVQVLVHFHCCSEWFMHEILQSVQFFEHGRNNWKAIKCVLILLKGRKRDIW